VARDALHPSGTDLLAHDDFPDWEAALRYFGERAKRERVVLVLDEFPYLADAEPALPSLIQRFWDQEGRASKLRLVLCGSAQAVMEELQTERAPLFGRVDARLQLSPFDYREAALFLPRLSPADQAVAYGVLGGMPTYLTRWDDSVGTLANLRRLFADPTSSLIEEGEFVLSSELPEGSGYFRILRAIAAGHRTYGAIKTFADIEIERQLDRLLRIGLLERVVPVTEDPTRSKRAVYRIADNFLAFWFRFVYRHRADIARGLGREVVDRVIVPSLSDYMGEPWEEMCREFLRRQAARGRLPVHVTSLGRWWNRDNSVEIDAVGVEGHRVALAGSVKWAATVRRTELNRLRKAVEALPDRADELKFVLFARDQVREVQPEEASIFTAEDLYVAD
jgi:AAA+ ATPase superfamily predicted ATPase